MVRPPPISTRFPYTTLFRSRRWRAGVRRHPALEAEAYVRVEGDQTRHREGSEPEAGQQCVADPHDPCNGPPPGRLRARDRKSTRLNSSHMSISYAVFCLKK